MILYSTIIGICWLFFAGLFSVILQEGFLMTFAWIGVGIVLAIVLDGLTATLVRLLPQPKEGKFFKVSLKEKNRYEKWHIRKWKDRVPEIGHFTGFRKNKLDAPKDAGYVGRFLMESRYGEVGHIVSCFSVALIFLMQLFSVFPDYWWMICLVVLPVNGILNMLTVFVLRYNYYKLNLLYKMLEKKGKAQSLQSAE